MTASEHDRQPSNGSVVRGLWVALSMYSTMPVPLVEFTPANMRWAMVWFPLVGAITGGILWGFAYLAMYLGLNQIVFAGLALCISFFISGGIHLDGFCDAADAIGSRRSAEEQLRIMKDPHAGPFAIMMLAFLLISQCAFYTQFYGSTNWRLWASLLLGLMYERALSGLSIVLFPKARQDGLAKLFGDPTTKAVARTLLIVTLVLIGGLIAVGLWVGLAMIIFAGLWFGQYYRFTKKRYGGVTGDLAGFFLTIAEWIMLLILAVGTGLGW